MSTLVADRVASRRAFKRPLLAEEKRSPEQVIEHYEVEIGLAQRLRRATPEARPALYGQVYDELFRRVPHHQQLTQKESAEDRAARSDGQMAFLRRFIEGCGHFLEVGAGDCALSLAAAPVCDKVTAVDVSEVVAGRDNWPDNVQFRVTRGTQIPAEDTSVDVAFSDQLMEHLHPDDAEEQLGNIFRALRPGGRYVCVTPNSVSGPWDISMYFDETASGLHLKEYRAGELHRLLLSVGFSRVHYYAGGRGFFQRVPKWLVTSAERALMMLPYGLRSRLARTLPVRGLLGLRLVAWKD